MKKHLLLCLFYCLFTHASIAQTALATGDIAFTGYNADNTPDNFSFIVLKTGGIASGTQIRFTDWGWLSGACGTNGWGTTAETEVLWTASSTLPYGTQVVISGTTTSTGTVSGSAISLSSGGDQLFAFQGTRTGPHTMLAGIHMNEEPGFTSGANWDNLGTITGTQSNRPPCLVNGTHALFINPEVDNARLKTNVVITGNPATDRAAINNAANWDVDDTNPFLLPASLIFLPVKFTYVKITAAGTSLQWGVADEWDILQYIIEKSADGRNFFAAGFVLPSRLSDYSWTVDSLSGSAFYRVKAVGRSGSFFYSAIIRYLHPERSGHVLVSGSQSRLLIRLGGIPEDSYRVDVYSSDGRQVSAFRVSHTGTAGSYHQDLPPGCGRGVFYLQLAGKKLSVTTKFVLP